LDYSSATSNQLPNLYSLNLQRSNYKMFEMALMLAQDVVANDFGRMGVGIGIGLIIMGAGLGIGRIGGSAVDAISRQPEAVGSIQTAMIIAAALIEGATVIALVFMFLI